MEQTDPEELQESRQSGSIIVDMFSNDISFEIFSRLPMKDVLTCRLVCRNWRDNPATLLILRTNTKPINIRSNIELKYFSWLMRTTPGAQIPFSKFAFHFDQDVAPNVVGEFLSRYALDVTELAIHFYIQKRVTYKISKWDLPKHSSCTRVEDYRQSVPLLLLNSLNLTSLYLTVHFDFTFPSTDDSSYVQAFQYLKKFKVKFELLYSGDRPTIFMDATIFDNIIKNSPRLQVLTLLYYPYFCSVNYDYPGCPEMYRGDGTNHAKDTIFTEEMRKLPRFLSLLRSSSTKVKLRLGIITDKFRKAFNQLSNLDPQPRIVALAISLPPELDPCLSTSIWKWIQTLPLSKLKFFENYSHYYDIPDLPTKLFHSLHQLRLTRLTPITLNDNHLLFPNLRKLSIQILVSEKILNGPSMSPSFESFCSLVANVPHLEHLRLTGDVWEILTAEPFRDNESHEAIQNYVLQQIENQRGKACEIWSPIKKLKKLRTLQIDSYFDSLCAAAYASETGRLHRLSQFIFMTKAKLGSPYYVEGVVAAILRKSHDKVEFPNKYIKNTHT